MTDSTHVCGCMFILFLCNDIVFILCMNVCVFIDSMNDALTGEHFKFRCTSDTDKKDLFYLF